ncbi:MAG: hypothetical protein OEY51_08530, partial [Cyclobacteriaceae bacterium]|nr:hypothetical protein [Cyclobacteriaceae bacterium]
MFLFLGCSSEASYTLTGVIHDGLNGKALADVTVRFAGQDEIARSDKNGRFILNISIGDTPGVVIKESGGIIYLKKTGENSDIRLVAETKGYQPLEYEIYSKIADLTLNMLPEPPDFEEDDYRGDHLSHTTLLKDSVQWENIIDGVGSFYKKRIEGKKAERERFWDRDLSSKEHYSTSVEPNRNKLRAILGAIDAREKPVMEIQGIAGETEKYTIQEVRWNVQKEIVPGPATQDWPALDVPGKNFGEGLLVKPRGKSRG